MSKWLPLDFSQGTREIDDCAYLFANRIREIEELTLEIIIAEAKAQPTIHVAMNDSQEEQLKAGGSAIETDLSCRSFRLVFNRNGMIHYSVLNESYGKYPGVQETFSGKLMRIFTESHLLNFVRATTHACDIYPGPFLHYQIACLNHVIDVIATEPPIVYTLVLGSSEKLARLAGSQPDIEDIPPRRNEIN